MLSYLRFSSGHQEEYILNLIEKNGQSFNRRSARRFLFFERARGHDVHPIHDLPSSEQTSYGRLTFLLSVRWRVLIVIGKKKNPWNRILSLFTCRAIPGLGERSLVRAYDKIMIKKACGPNDFSLPSSNESTAAHERSCIRRGDVIPFPFCERWFLPYVWFTEWERGTGVIRDPFVSLSDFSILFRSSVDHGSLDSSSLPIFPFLLREGKMRKRDGILPVPSSGVLAVGTSLPFHMGSESPTTHRLTMDRWMTCGS